MAMKTNKSYAKRMKVTKNGTILVRKPGHNHFNAKESRRSQLNKKRKEGFEMTAKSRSRYLVNVA